MPPLSPYLSDALRLRLHYGTLDRDQFLQHRCIIFSLLPNDPGPQEVERCSFCWDDLVISPPLSEEEKKAPLDKNLVMANLFCCHMFHFNCLLDITANFRKWPLCACRWFDSEWERYEAYVTLVYMNSYRYGEFDKPKKGFGEMVFSGDGKALGRSLSRAAYYLSIAENLCLSMAAAGYVARTTEGSNLVRTLKGYILNGGLEGVSYATLVKLLKIKAQAVIVMEWVVEKGDEALTRTLTLFLKQERLERLVKDGKVLRLKDLAPSEKLWEKVTSWNEDLFWFVDILVDLGTNDAVQQQEGLKRGWPLV